MQTLIFASERVTAVRPIAKGDGPERTMVEVRETHVAQVRGFEVELYVRTERPPVFLRLVDHGEWRVGGYVRWAMERHFPDFNILDELDEKLRSHFSPGQGTVHRADQPVSIPSVRLSSIR